MNIQKLGNTIRQRRKQRKLTQEVFAQRAEVSVSLVGQLERGTREDVGLNALQRMFAVLGIELCLFQHEQ